MASQPRKRTHMTSRLHKLPVSRSAMPGESGMSLLLRTATANAISLHALRDQAGITTVRPLTANDAMNLAPILGMQTADLGEMLVSKGRYLGSRALRYQGHLFLRTGLVRTGKPQVCLSCLHRNGFCKAVWDCVFYTVCHVHHIPLIDRCSDCASPLSWYRPAIDVCRCHAYFRATGPVSQPEDDRPSLLAAWIENHFDEISDQVLGTSHWPRWVSELSVDALCSVVQAFGVCTVPHEKVPSKTSVKAREVGHWNAVASRGLDRLENFYAHPSARPVLKDLIWEGGLEAIALRCVKSSDRQVAQLLLLQAFGAAASATFGSHRATLSQLSLF